VTRFEATDSTERRKLFADAIRAHRERGSRFCTFELDAAAVASGEPTGERGDETGDDERTPVPWVQFGDRTFNLDCIDAELDRLEELLNDYPEFRIDARESPEDVEGTNLRIVAKSDAGRLAAFVDEAFRRVYGADEGYRAWVTEI